MKSIPQLELLLAAVEPGSDQYARTLEKLHHTHVNVADWLTLAIDPVKLTNDALRSKLRTVKYHRAQAHFYLATLVAYWAEKDGPGDY
jgi:hypothetical protein